MKIKHLQIFFNLWIKTTNQLLLTLIITATKTNFNKKLKRNSKLNMLKKRTDPEKNYMKLECITIMKNFGLFWL